MSDVFSYDDGRDQHADLPLYDIGHRTSDIGHLAYSSIATAIAGPVK
jgi:hypothetical protein